MRNKNYYFVFACLLISGILFGNLAGCKNGEKKPVHEDEECHDEENVVEISSKAREIMQLETGKIALRHIKKSLKITGEIAQDCENIFHVTAEEPGKIIQIKSQLGDHIRKGQVIAVLKSSIDGKIKEIRAPSPCTITGQTISEGEKVDTLTSLFAVSDLSVMKAGFDVYEKDISLIKTGKKINVKTISYPDKTYRGKIL
jgi:cobalt-zinc-cadmium efflux system membrane fusion protein